MEHWQAPYVERANEVAGELSSIVGTLDEMIVDHLRTALENDVAGRPPLDKNLQAARRSLEKAIRLLTAD